jgi:hypothetical protein
LNFNKDRARGRFAELTAENSESDSDDADSELSEAEEAPYAYATEEEQCACNEAPSAVVVDTSPTHADPDASAASRHMDIDDGDETILTG